MLKFLRVLFVLPVILSFCLTGGAKAQTLTSDLDEDTLLLAATLWGEARDSSYGMQVVANIIMNIKNEQENEKGTNISIKSIVSNTDQFASWKDRSFDTSQIIKDMSEKEGFDKESWETCLNYAKLALQNKLGDVTDGATSFSKNQEKETPEWARGKTETSVTTEKTESKSATTEEIASSQSSGANSSAYNTGAPEITGGGSASCNGVEAVSRDLSSKTNSGYGVISDKTMQNMTNLLDRIYKNLGRVFMLGHGVLCYATRVAYHCFGIDVPLLPSACWIKAPNLTFFICGLAIYLTAFLMSVAIGMYFIDICFKLGFAIMYLPVTIALWPFAPTKSKFGEAFGMVLHNAMLYAFMSIGVTYAIVLIYNGILGDASNWTSFWSAIEKESSELLAENFSLTSTRIIVIMFCLIFGFKIISSSVNDYLDYFFSDGLMGGQSPMHYLGTQAIGMTAGAVLGKVGAYASDVATAQAGKGLERVGDALIDYSKGGGTVADASKAMATPINKFMEGAERLRTNNYQQDPAARSTQASNPATSGMKTNTETTGASTTQTGGTPAQAGGTPTQAGGTPAQAEGTPAQAGGTATRQGEAFNSSYNTPQSAERTSPDAGTVPETGNTGTGTSAGTSTERRAAPAAGNGGANVNNTQPAHTNEDGAPAQQTGGLTISKTYNLGGRDKNSLSPEELKKFETGEQYQDAAGNVVNVYRDTSGNVLSVYAQPKGRWTTHVDNGEMTKDQIDGIMQKLQSSPADLKDVMNDVSRSGNNNIPYNFSTSGTRQTGDNPLNQAGQGAQQQAQQEAQQQAPATPESGDNRGFFRKAAGKLGSGVKILGEELGRNWDKQNRKRPTNFYADLERKRTEEKIRQQEENLVNRTDADRYDENN